MTEVQKLLAQIVGVCLVILGIYAYGIYQHHQGFKECKADYDQKAEQAAEENKINNQQTENQHKKDIENAKSKAGKLAISNWLKSHSLLPSSNGCKTNSTEVSDGKTSKSDIGDRIEEFSQGCAVDALKVLEWQEWATRENLPIK